MQDRKIIQDSLINFITAIQPDKQFLHVLIRTKNGLLNLA